MGNDQLRRIREKAVQKGKRLLLAVLIQSVGRLIRNQQPCFGAKRQCDGHTLRHTAGKLEGILLQNGFRLGEAHL